MGTRLYPIGALSLALGLAAAASPGNAQPARPWVDPPPEAGASTPSPPPAPAVPEAKAAAPQPDPASTAATAEGKEPMERRSTGALSAAEQKPAAKTLPQRAVTERRDRKPSREVTAARSERQRQMNQRRDLAEQTSRSARAARVREGVNAGLEVMTLRTIEFPDGRRVQILTRPQPGAMSELLDRPQ